MDETKTDGGPEESADSIKITDRRLFTADGVLRGEVTEDRPDPEPDPTPPPPVQSSASTAEAEAGFETQPGEAPPGVDFKLLLNAMAEPALLFLGEIPHPETGQPEVDLERARIQIDMLDLLRVKCKGNLSNDEDSLLDRILYQLRMLYLTRKNQSALPTT